VRRGTATALAAACVAVAVAVVLALLRPANDAELRLPSSAPIGVTKLLTSTSALFGDRLEAEIDVVTARPAIEPDTVRLVTDFRPYAAVATSIERARRGPLDLLRTRISLDCLTPACLTPIAGARTFRLVSVAVRYRENGRDRTLTEPWSTVQVASRLQRRDERLAEAPPALGDALQMSPTAARAALVALTAVLGVAGAWFVLTGIWPHLFSPQRRWRRLTPLEQALAQLEAAAEIEDDGVRRRVLEQLARRLGEADLPALERRSRTLAWSAAAPAREQLGRLGEQVRASLDGGSP
jgi:hypothetical protein